MAFFVVPQVLPFDLQAMSTSFFRYRFNLSQERTTVNNVCAIYM